MYRRLEKDNIHIINRSIDGPRRWLVKVSGRHRIGFDEFRRDIQYLNILNQRGMTSFCRYRDENTDYTWWFLNTYKDHKSKIRYFGQSQKTTNSAGNFNTFYCSPYDFFWCIQNVTFWNQESYLAFHLT